MTQFFLNKDQLESEQQTGNWLEGRQVYLCGAMEDNSKLGKSWRTCISPILEERYGLVVLNPLEKHKYFKGLSAEEEQEIENEISDLKTEETVEKFSRRVGQICYYDLSLVDRSDFFILRHLQNVEGCGTWCEFTYAEIERKPILIWTDGDSIMDINGWPFGIVPHETFFTEWGDLQTYLDRISRGEIDMANADRWAL